MKKIISLLVSILFIINTTAQVPETIGAGIIDFLVRNPKSANRMNQTEHAALNVLSGLLKIGAARKHDMNVADAGQSEIIINNGNEPAKLYMGIDGKVYLLSGGIIYPIEKSLVEQAGNIKQESNGYDMQQLEADFSKELESGESGWYYLKENGHYFSELKTIFFNDDLIWNGSANLSPRMARNKVPITTTKRFWCKKVPKGQINTIFLCNWHKASTEHAIVLQDYHGIKNKFKINERFEITTSVRLREDIAEAIVELSFFTSLGVFIGTKSQRVTNRDAWTLSSEIGMPTAEKYTIYATLKVNGIVIAVKQVKFEITAE